MSWEDLLGSTTQTEDESLVLEPGEVVLARESDVLMDNDERLEEVILTNRHLILGRYERASLFTIQMVYLHCPLRRLRNEDGSLEIHVTRSKGSHAVTLVFGKEPVMLRFGRGTRRVQEEWAQRIANAADRAPQGRAKNHAPKKKSPLVTRRCIGCQAPLTGRKGEVVTCEYCDTRQVL